jgi:hypothetical protein
LNEHNVWYNKDNQVTTSSSTVFYNTNYNQSPHQVEMVNNTDEPTYRFLISAGRFEYGNPSRLVVGTNALSLNAYYNLTHHPLLTPFQSLSSSTYELVIVMMNDVYFQQWDSLTFSYGTGTRDDVHLVTPIYSFDQGVTWTQLDTSTSFTTGSSSGTFSFSGLQQAGMTLRVGLLFENTFNYGGNDINFSNPSLSLSFDSLSDEEQATLFASEIEPYSPCADELNGMTQLTEEKQTELLNLYTQLSAGGKAYLHTIPMGDGFSAYERYVYLMQPL